MAGPPVCRYCGADCSDGRSWDGGDLYACTSCANRRAETLTIDAALRVAEGSYELDTTREAAEVLAAEVRRLRVIEHAARSWTSTEHATDEERRTAAHILAGRP